MQVIPRVTDEGFRMSKAENKGTNRHEQARKRKRAFLVFFGCAAVIYLSLSFFLGDKGFVRYVKLRKQKAELVADIAQLKTANDGLNRKVQALKSDPAYIEELAREKGMAKEGEIIYQYEDPK